MKPEIHLCTTTLRQSAPKWLFWGSNPLYPLHGLCLAISCVMLCGMAAQAHAHTSFLPKYPFLHCMRRV